VGKNASFSKSAFLTIDPIVAEFGFVKFLLAFLRRRALLWHSIWGMEHLIAFGMAKTVDISVKIVALFFVQVLN